MTRNPKKMVVVLARQVTLPHRVKPEDILSYFTVYALTKPQAVKAVKDAGHKGRLVEVITK